MKIAEDLNRQNNSLGKIELDDQTQKMWDDAIKNLASGKLTIKENIDTREELEEKLKKAKMMLSHIEKYCLHRYTQETSTILGMMGAIDCIESPEAVEETKTRRKEYNNG